MQRSFYITIFSINQSTISFQIDLYQKVMNQRSISVMRKLRTELPEDISFDKKIAKAIQQKKSIISKMKAPKCQTQRLLTYRGSQINKTRVNHQNSRPIINQNKPIKSIKLSQQMIKQYIQRSHPTSQMCINHPTKKGAFQDKQSRYNVYCHQCAIKMVKDNIKVITLNQEIVMFKRILNNQLQLIREQQEKVISMIQDYYQSIRKMLQVCYSEFIEQRRANQSIVIFGQFHQNKDSLNQILQKLGRLQQVKFKLILDQNKENIGNQINKDIVDVQKYNSRSNDCSFEIKKQINYSLQHLSKQPISISRSRENSFCRKGQKLQYKKAVNLR